MALTHPSENELNISDRSPFRAEIEFSLSTGEKDLQVLLVSQIEPTVLLILELFCVLANFRFLFGDTIKVCPIVPTISQVLPPPKSFVSKIQMLIETLTGTQMRDQSKSNPRFQLLEVIQPSEMSHYSWSGPFGPHCSSVFVPGETTTTILHQLGGEWESEFGFYTIHIPRGNREIFSTMTGKSLDGEEIFSGEVDWPTPPVPTTPPRRAPRLPKEATSIRFSAKGFAAQRYRLGLSVAEMGLLLGVSAKTIYTWEAGKSRPRQQQLAAIAAVRSLGKREAAARLLERAT